MHRVKDVEEIFTWWTFACWVFIGEILSKLNILLELWPQVLNGELIIVRHRDLKYLSFLHEVLLARKHILQEVFIDDILIGQIVLYYRGIRQ